MKNTVRYFEVKALKALFLVCFDRVLISTWSTSVIQPLKSQLSNGWTDLAPIPLYLTILSLLTSEYLKFNLSEFIMYSGKFII